jgi:hypothetical protein
MRPDSAEWHKARIQLEGNPVFQALRLELDTLREERAELIEALREQHSALSITLAAVDAAATGATLTAPDGYAANIRSRARKQLQDVSALLSRLEAK